jgi:hypothetical protein
LAASDGITIYPIERLGNQLFIWATGLAQARRLSAPCYVSLGFFNQFPEHEYVLDAFDSGVVKSDSPADDRILPLRYMFRPAGGVAVLPGSISLRAFSVFVERGFGYDERVATVAPGVTLVGYFQSWRYFASIAAEIRERLTNLRSPSPWYQNISREISPGSGAVIVHVRRGDYLNPETHAFHGLTTRAYYRRALTHLRALGMSGRVYVMSDAVDAALMDLEGLGDIHAITPPAGTDPLESLLILGRADALVAANSSFSWWGGFVGERPDRPVIAPRPWFTAQIDTRDLLLPSWVTLGREDEDFENHQGPGLDVAGNVGQ